MEETPFVTYLNRYTTVSADHEAAFDEYLSETPPPPGGPLTLATRVETFIKECFHQPRPPSIILTGNAGDGKTYLSRQVIETFTESGFPGWSDTADWSISRSDLILRVIKDLSELDEESGKEKLLELAQKLANPTSKTVFLIAANEGRLRKLLASKRLGAVRAEVERQLATGADTTSSVVVINLNETTTSSYVPQALRWLTSEANWPDLTQESAETCPIHFNVVRLRDEFVQGRIQLLYRILEHLGIHVTIRDLLIHLAFTVTAGHDRAELARMPVERKADFAYYDNIFGLSASSLFRQRSAVVSHLTRLKLGDYSRFELDNFVINGHEPSHELHMEHGDLFGPALDLGQRRFQQERDAYLFGTGTQDEAATAFLRWLPHARRKLFFEWRRTYYTNKLFLFSTTAEYFDLLERPDPPKLDRYLRELVLGLNRAFSDLYLNEDQTLYLTTQYAQSGDTKVPIVKLQMSVNSNLELEVRPQASEAIDQDSSWLTIMVFPPRQVKADELEWRLDLMLFEYLLRRARGGTPNVLAAECDLQIRRMKDDLIKNIVLGYKVADKVEFFAAYPSGYKLTTLYLTGDGKLRLSGGQ